MISPVRIDDDDVNFNNTHQTECTMYTEGVLKFVVEKGCCQFFSAPRNYCRSCLQATDDAPFPVKHGPSSLLNFNQSYLV